ncbi:hypothetical protein [Spirillospora sp. NPDC047279]|uniref:hypothetical protein n=1 Tax=Spirillospora sp. NPDC047279 TaxID=3155478 RepID=UPI0033FA2B6D
MPNGLGTVQVRRLHAGVGAAILVLTVGACDSGTAAKPTPTVTVTATPAPDAAQILTKAQTAFAKTENVRVTDDGSAGDRLVFAYGEAEKITAPRDAVDFSKQGTFKQP